MSFGIFQFRRGTFAAMTAANILLGSGELFLETDTNKFKIGDGTTLYNSLPYGGLVGPAGRGITSITRTSGTGAAGTIDTYTITYSDATTSTFSVTNGANGATGQAAYTTTTANFTQPAVNSTVSVSVASSAWMTQGMIIYIGNGGYYTVTTISNSTSIVVTNLGYAGNATPGATVTSGSSVSSGGLIGVTGNPGQDASTTTTANFTQPAVSSTVSVSVVSTVWMTTNAIVFINGGGYYSVNSITNTTTVVLTNLGYTGNATPGATISSGSKVISSGIQGATGNTGATGQAAYTTTTANFTQPAVAATVSVSVVSTTWMTSGMTLFVGGGGYYTVSSITNTTTVVLNNTGYTGNTAPGGTISSGSGVSSGGIQGIQGNTGATGQNAYTTTTANFTQPAVAATVSVSFVSTAWMGLNGYIYIEGGGFYVVSSITNATTAVITNLAKIAANSAPGTVINSGAKVSASGAPFSNDRITYTSDELGFVGDCITLDSNCSITAGTATLTTTSATASFSQATDVGKRITISGAGTAGAKFVTTIASVQSTTSITLAANAVTTVSNRSVIYGTDNTTACNNLISLVNNAIYGIRLTFNQSNTNSYGIPIPLSFNKTIQMEGIGGGHTADTGDYTRIGGTRLVWFSDTSDGGVPFGAFITVNPTGVQSIKRAAFRHLWLDCRNGDEANALIGLKLFSCHGFMIDDFFVMDPLAIGIYTDVGSTPTEAKDTTRFSINDWCVRALDTSDGLTTAPTTTSTAVSLTTTATSLTLAAATISAATSYAWVMSSIGMPVLIRYTGGGGTTTLTGVTTTAELSINAPATVAGSNIVNCAASNAAGLVLSGGTGANTCCGLVQMGQISHGTTWGPAAMEFFNSDSIEFHQIMVNGGNATNDGLINRIRKPGVRQNGSNTAVSLAARNNTFISGDPGAGGISCMASLNTGARMAFPSGPTYWSLMQLGNGAPVPTVESGASLEWTPNGGLLRGGHNASVADQAVTGGTLTLINGTLLTLPPQALQIGTVLNFACIGTSIANGVAANTIVIRLGTTGTTADAAIATFTTTAGTAAISTYKIECNITCRSAPSATAAFTGTCVVNNGSATGTGAGFINSLVNVLPGTMATGNTLTSGLLYAHMTITSGAAKNLTITQAWSEVINPANP